MFQLLQPIWLFAITGIFVPIIIHLWDVQGGKRLKVGSILLIEESARLQGRSLRLTEILLLILRCLLIILLAIILSRPVFKKHLSITEEKGWLLIEKQSLGKAYNHNKIFIDSLIKEGYKFHYFNEGFIARDFEEALEGQDSLASEEVIDYWTLLKQLNERVPHELPLHLFIENKLRHFQSLHFDCLTNNVLYKINIMVMGRTANIIIKYRLDYSF